MLITLLQAVVLGLIQGATEFIPVSSSAHLVIVPWLFGWSEPALTSLPFDTSLHLGTLIAVLIFFGKDWVRLIQAGFASIRERKIGADPDRRMAWFIVLGTLPGAVLGILAESKIDALFHQPGVPIQREPMLVMAFLIALLGAALLLADRLARHTKELKGLTLKEVLVIGFAQALALFPGISRSGSTITAGLALGFKRADAAKFSFLLSAPIIAAAGGKGLVEVISQLKSGALAGQELALFGVGLLAAAISGYLCIHFLLQYLQKHSVAVFVYYRWALAAIVAIVALVR
jgi:undecaprenyl-diphosphatase